MTTIAHCSNIAEAELLHSLLTDSGIQVFVGSDIFGGAVRVQVAEESVDEAKRIIAEAELTSDEQDKLS